MVIAPKVRGFICTTAHPQGCAQHVEEWIQYIKNQNFIKGPKKVLVIGASTGFGLASRITAAFAAKAQTIGVFFERPAENNKRTATAGWYNTAAFEKKAQAAKLYAKSINGDAFSDEIKKQTIELIKKDWQGQVDLVIYSIAAPRRIHPKTAAVYASVLKPIGKSYHNKTVDVLNATVSDIEIDPATTEEIDNTVAVMGGEDWQYWIEALIANNLLAPNAKTVAYTYLGPELTHAIYRQGTIGRAKEHLEKTAKILETKLQKTCGGHAYISVNKALVTQASAAIPVVPLYISLLYKIMKAKGLQEGCIEQMYRLFANFLYTQEAMKMDSEGRIRLDNLEMRADVQAEVSQLWPMVTSENLEKLADIEGYREEFYKLFGFGFPNVDYTQDVAIDIKIDSLGE